MPHERLTLARRLPPTITLAKHGFRRYGLEMPNLTLYKFCRYSEFALEMLSSKTFWLANPSSFNDPFDCKYTLQANPSPADLDAVIQRFVPTQQRRNLANHRTVPTQHQRLIRIIRETVEKVFAEVGVYCFCERWRSNLMWSHYADKHQGLCLRFSVDPTAVRPDPALAAVTYSKTYPVLNVGDLVANLGGTCYQALYSKSPQWKYEKEWRLVSPTGNRAVSWNMFTLTEVIFGKRVRNSSIALVKLILANQKVKFFVAEPSQDSYKFKKIRV